ncbi:hypothetical protein GCM10025771_01970 [Niveibacterium umoris]|uniref:WD40 repeat protein/uncharacterized caspase-like protein n=1 Tax=Niveibacterium umoris TaxID=1193620 RepID=A0A840BMP7_9RHOO|nr:hypothetical protein [Niveibacterium umoris]MBB4014260.1 WD40 repeat protein/uncharacterized caspase-like protein [Niveibacterium umoris]
MIQRSLRLVLRLLLPFPLLAAPDLGAAPAEVTATMPRLVVQSGHSGNIDAMQFSPDDQLLATGGNDKRIKLWSVDDARELRTITAGADRLTALAWLPGGTALVSGDEGGEVRIWNAAAGAMLRSWHCSGEQSSFLRVADLAVTERGAAVAVACGDRIRLYDKAEDRAKSENWLVLLDPARAQPRLRIALQHRQVSSLAWSTDGREIFVGDEDGSLRIFDATTGALRREWQALGGTVMALAPDPGGRWLAAAIWTRDSQAGRIEIVAPASGRRLRTIPTPLGRLRQLQAAPDGRWLAAVDEAAQLRRFDPADGRELLPALAIGQSGHQQLALSHDGRRMATSDWSSLVIRTAADGQVQADLSAGVDGVLSMALAPDGRSLVAGNQQRGRFGVWSLTEGRLVRQLETDGLALAGAPAGGLALSPDGAWIVALTDGALQWWPTGTTGTPRRTPLPPDFNGPLVFSDDARWLAVGGRHVRALLLDARSGDTTRVLEAAAARGVDDSYVVQTLNFSHDGQTLLVAGSDAVAEVWLTATGERRCTLDTSITAATLLRGDRLLATGNNAGGVRLWDYRACEAVYPLQEEDELLEVKALRFSSDGELLASAGEDNLVTLWRLDDTPHRLHGLQGHESSVQALAFADHDRLLFSASTDGTIRLWRSPGGELLATLVAFSDGRWVVTDPEGRFDTADLESIPYLHWVLPDDPFRAVPLEAFMKDYFEPRLLARILAGEHFAPVRPLASLNRTPVSVRITAIEPDPSDAQQVSVTVEAAGATSRPRNGAQATQPATAAHDLRLFRDGQIVGHADGRLATPGAGRYTQRFSVRLPRTATQTRSEVRFSAYAFNDDRVKSPTARMSYETPAMRGRAATAERGKAYVISVGVNQHENPAWDLGFAANDARVLAASIVAALDRRGTYAQVVPLTLTSDGATRQASKAALRAVIARLAGESLPREQVLALAQLPGADALRKAGPDDLLLLSFAGHGFTDGGGQFYLIPQDTGGNEDGRRITPSLKAHAIGSDELSMWLRDVDAGDLTMIVDACQSAASVQSEGFKPGPMGSRGLGQLAFDKGMRILAASQSDEFALEDQRLRHGLLTYSLVHDGLQSRRADFAPPDQRIWLDEWLQYGVQRVPTLAEEIRSGKRPAGDRGARVHRESAAGGAAAPRPAQQPALFDFNKGRAGILLDQWP